MPRHVSVRADADALSLFESIAYSRSLAAIDHLWHRSIRMASERDRMHSYARRPGAAGRIRRLIDHVRANRLLDAPEAGELRCHILGLLSGLHGAALEAQREAIGDRPDGSPDPTPAAV